MKNRWLMSILGLAIAFGLLIAVNLLARGLFPSARLDLTEHELFTLSDGSKKILAGLDEPVTLQFFRSRKEAEKYIGPFARRTEEFLREFEAVSAGKLTVEVLDPEPFSEIEDRATQAGLNAFAGPPLAPSESLFFGLVGSNKVGDTKTLPFISPGREEFLEYDIAKLIYELAHPKKPIVGVLSALPVEGQASFGMRDAPQPWAIVDEMRNFSEVRTIQPSATEIPKDIEVLVVIHPKNFGDPIQYALDQFVLRGGKLVCFVDPWCDADVPPQDPNNPLQAYMAQRNSELPKLFDAWGVSFAKDQLATDKKFATPVSWQNRGRMEQINFTCWLMVPGDTLNKDDVTTSELQALNFRYPGFLEAKENATTKFTPLIQTSEESMEIATSVIQFSPDPPKLLADFFPSGKRMTLAARVTGKVATAFPGGKPKAAPDPDEPPPEPELGASHLSESNGDATIVIVADADMLADNSWVQIANFAGSRIPMKLADNGDFLINTLDYLRGSTDLVSLRARGGSSYPFKVVDELQRAAEVSYRAEEKSLTEEKEKTERELNDLISKSEGSVEQVLRSQDVQDKVANLRQTLVDTNKHLREVRFNLNNDVERLGTKLKLLNIVVVPVLVLAAAILVFLFRISRRKTA